MSSQDTEPGDGSVSVRHTPDRGRYEIAVDARPAGFVSCTDRGDQRTLFHTEIDEQFGGRGLAGELVAHALTHTRAAGLRIVPVCPYAAKWVRQHPDLAGALDAVTPAALAADRRAQS